ncbi:DMT family transporter [Roseomonas sp. BN140053]|uniref:DMT family transporter n=1 Tax=Roseomonas sp. BN140053 TaxID=3391898 RepID=UPI0039E95609
MRHDLRRGAALMLLAMFLLTLMGALVKEVTQRVPFVEVACIRNLLTLPVVVALAWRKGGLVWRTRRFGGHLARASTGICGMLMAFFALSALPLADQTVLSYTQPLFLILLAIPVLGERPTPRRWAAVLLGFGGVLVVALGQGIAGGQAPAWIYGLAVAQGLVAAVTVLLVRQLSGTESSTTIVLWQSVLMAALSGLPLPFLWQTPGGTDLLLLLAIGLVGGLGQVVLTESYASAQVSALGPYFYSGLIWAMLLGLLLFGEPPGVAMLAGSVLIVGAGLMILPGELRKP